MDQRTAYSSYGPSGDPLAASSQHVMRLDCREGERQTWGGVGGGMPGLYCTHCERAAFWINGDLQHHQRALIVS